VETPVRRNEKNLMEKEKNERKREGEVSIH